jgi:hypothetical protein
VAAEAVIPMASATAAVAAVIPVRRTDFRRTGNLRSLPGSDNRGPIARSFTSSCDENLPKTGLTSGCIPRGVVNRSLSERALPAQKRKGLFIKEI